MGSLHIERLDRASLLPFFVYVDKIIIASGDVGRESNRSNDDGLYNRK